MDTAEQNDGGEDRWDWASVPAGAGVLAITSKSTGRSYYLAVRDLRQRAYDAHRMLVLGVHHNPEFWTCGETPARTRSAAKIFVKEFGW